MARVPALLLKSCRKRYGDLVGRELLQSQIEISSPVFDSCAQARAEMTRLRRGVAEIAASLDLRLVASGTHPLAAWHEQVHTANPRYERLIDDFQIVGRRNLLCGLHVHVAVPAGVDRVDVMNRAVRWLPLFLALSTSSPFWNRQRTGLLSYRQAAYDEWPRTGIPDLYADEAEYRRFIAPAGAPRRDRRARLGLVGDPAGRALPDPGTAHRRCLHARSTTRWRSRRCTAAWCARWCGNRNSAAIAAR